MLRALWARQPTGAPNLRLAFADRKQELVDHGSFGGRLAMREEVVAIGIHDLGPGGNKVFHELLLRSRTGIDLCESTQLRVRTEDQIDPCSGPLERVGFAVPAL